MSSKTAEEVARETYKPKTVGEAVQEIYHIIHGSSIKSDICKFLTDWLNEQLAEKDKRIAEQELMIDRADRQIEKYLKGEIE